MVITLFMICKKRRVVSDSDTLNEPEIGGGAQNSTDWSPPSPPTTSKPVTLASFWILGELVIFTLCYKLSVEWTPVSDLVVERVKNMQNEKYLPTWLVDSFDFSHVCIQLRKCNFHLFVTFDELFSLRSSPLPLYAQCGCGAPLWAISPYLGNVKSHTAPY